MNALDDVRPRQQLDVMLRTAQQHHVQLSALADTKASILITISSIVLTIALSRADQPQLKPALVTLAAAALLSLLLAIVAVLPTFAPRSVRKGRSPRNLLFFGHFGMLSEEEFIREITPLLHSDALMYEAILRDLYGIGSYLYRKKYRFLRFAYVALLAGFIIATAVEVWVVWTAGALF
ncbi:MAG TPA: Pycsar system effector family protein [Thermoanaerobaculia bacterium]|nr:Pycsar system effector family protein [Thermoanaerobaculia bacterium]